MVGRLKPIELRNIWEREAKDFTSWLFDNIDILNEQIGIELIAEEIEARVGTFSVDITAKDHNGQLAIIENQLEETNHDHLGKIITYLTNIGAKTAIWISSDPRREHINAINYLNENAPADTSFYLIKLQAFKIGESEPAPLFTIEAGPSDEIKEIGKEKKELAETDQLRLEFFEQLIDKSNAKTKLFANVSAQPAAWISAGAGLSALSWSYVIRRHEARIDLTFHKHEEGKKRFEFLKGKREEIDIQFGEPLDWDFNEARKQNYIRTWSKVGGLLDKDKWEEIQNDLVDRMARLEKTFKPFITQLAKQSY